MTESPVFVVYSKQEICVDGEFDYDKIIYVKSDDDYPQLTYSEYEELEKEYNRDYRSIDIDSSGEQVIYESPKDPCSGEAFDPDDWEKRYVKFVDKFEQAFFVRKNAEDFIESQSHNLNSPYIFVESAWRNPEWQQIRELLIDKARIEGDNVSH